MAGSNPETSAYSQTYTVHTGTDIYAVFNDTIATTAQGISYSITRQKAPVYVLGYVDARSVARSKRGIAGSMIMTTFDRHCLGDFMANSLFAAKRGTMEVTGANPYGVPTASVNPGQTPIVVNNTTVGGVTGGQYDPSAYPGNLIDATSTGPSTGMSLRARPMYTDQLMPFDCTLAARNEYDQGSSMRVFGLEILNEGSGISIDDTSNEVQLTYIARLLTPWVSEDIQGGSSLAT